MWFFIPVLVFLRLLMWHLFPQIGIGHYSDIVFGTVCLTVLVVYGFIKKRTMFSYPLILLTLTIAITTYINKCSDLDIKYLFTFDIYMLIVLAVLSIETTRQVKWLLGCLLGYALLSAVVGIWQVAALHLHRAPGLQGWPLSLAGQLLLFMPWALNNLTLRSGVIGVGFLSAFSVLPALSLGVMYLQNRTLLFLALCLSLPALYYKNILGAWGVRMEYYQRAFDYLSYSPLVGVGTGKYVYSEISPSVFVHNSYLQIWIEQGIVGFIAIIWLAVLIFQHPIISRRWVWVGLCAFLIDNLFSYTILKPNTSLLFWVMFAAYANLYTKENPLSHNKGFSWAWSEGRRKEPLETTR